ncbi:hypothetical protein PHMEG_00028354, partial [Phytophthora megakarya]
MSKEKATTTRRTTVKIKLGWESVYVFAMVDVLLGTDFMIPAVVRLDMFHSNANLPEEVTIPLVKLQAMKNEPERHYEVSGPIRTMNIPRRKLTIPLVKLQAMKNEPEKHYEVSGPILTMNIPRRKRKPFKVSKTHPSPKTHDVWIRRTESVVPTVTSYRKRRPYRVRLTNITNHTVFCPAHPSNTGIGY